MRKRVLVATTLACLLAAAPATAAERGAPKRFEVKERHLSIVLVSKVRDGYIASIKTNGHRQVTLSLIRGKAEIEARTSGRVTRDGIEASFGDLGEISVRFKPNRSGSRISEILKQHHRRSGCRGRAPSFALGTFTGTIRFEADGFPRLDAKRFGGLVQQRYRRSCPAETNNRPIRAALEKLFGGIRLTVLRSHARVDGANVLFEAQAADLTPLFGRGAGYEATFSASSVEHLDGVRLTRSVGAEGDEGSFLFSGKSVEPQTATVTPPGKPFAGSAEYAKEKGNPATWSGSLGARIPGAGLVPLTTPGFRSELCRGSFAALLEDEAVGCLSGSKQDRAETLRRLSPLLPQGSGSQSQVFWDARLSWSR